MKKYARILYDILKENGKYSQGRIYLFISVVSYYLTLGILLSCGVSKVDLDMENFKIIIDALSTAMTLFGGYVFGGKFLEVVKSLKGSDQSSDQINS